MIRYLFMLERIVHCRTGSLEKTEFSMLSKNFVHCRTGSLEKLRELK